MLFDTLGNVHACCQNYEHVLGNVAQDRIKDIWLTKRTAILRKALENDSFAAGCRFLKEQEFAAGNYRDAFASFFDRFPILTRSPEWPSQMEFEVSNTCNFACVMCSGGSYRRRFVRIAKGSPHCQRPTAILFFMSFADLYLTLNTQSFLVASRSSLEKSLHSWELMIEEGQHIPSHVTTNGSQYNARRVSANCPRHPNGYLRLTRRHDKAHPLRRFASTPSLRLL